MRLWNPLQKGNTVEFEGRVYTPDMVLGPARKGIKVTYCTDSRPLEHIVEAAEGSDLFICEGMYAEKEKIVKAKQYKHMTFYEAADMAKRAGVKELWLTHFSPVTCPCRGLYATGEGYFCKRISWKRCKECGAHV